MLRCVNCHKFTIGCPRHRFKFCGICQKCFQDLRLDVLANPTVKEKEKANPKAEIVHLNAS